MPVDGLALLSVGPSAGTMRIRKYMLDDCTDYEVRNYISEVSNYKWFWMHLGQIDNHMSSSKRALIAYGVLGNFKC